MDKFDRFISKFFIIILFVLCVSCQEMLPAGFWSHFLAENLVENNSDQGLYGGIRSLHWRSSKDKTFKSVDLLAFARSKGWEIIDSLDISRETINSWESRGPKFPFTYGDSILSNNQNLVFPRWIITDAKLYRFSTGWIAIEPGYTRETSKNGYILISTSGREFSIYHLWGD